MPLDSPSAADSASAPLGLRNPLLPQQPLGQNWLHPTFLTPLGASSLGVLDPTVFSSQATSDHAPPEAAFADSPFFRNHRPQSIRSPAPAAPPPAAGTPAGRASPTSLTIQTRFEPASEPAWIDSIPGLTAASEPVAHVEDDPSDGEETFHPIHLAGNQPEPRPHPPVSSPQLQARLNPAPATAARRELADQPAPSQQAAEPSVKPIVSTAPIVQAQPRASSDTSSDALSNTSSKSPSNEPSVQTGGNENAAIQSESSSLSLTELPGERPASSSVNATPLSQIHPHAHHAASIESIPPTIQTSLEASSDSDVLQSFTAKDSSNPESLSSNVSNSRSPIQNLKSPAPPQIQPRLESLSSPLPAAADAIQKAHSPNPDPAFSAEVGLHQSSLPDDQALWDSRETIGDYPIGEQRSYRPATAQQASPSHHGPSDLPDLPDLPESVSSHPRLQQPENPPGVIARQPLSDAPLDIQSPNPPTLKHTQTVQRSLDSTDLEAQRSNFPLKTTVHSSSPQPQATTPDFGVPEFHSPLPDSEPSQPSAPIHSATRSESAVPGVQPSLAPPIQRHGSADPDAQPDDARPDIAASINQPSVLLGNEPPDTASSVAAQFPERIVAPALPKFASTPMVSPALEEGVPEASYPVQAEQPDSMTVSAKQSATSSSPTVLPLSSSPVSLQRQEATGVESPTAEVHPIAPAGIPETVLTEPDSKSETAVISDRRQPEAEPLSNPHSAALSNREIPTIDVPPVIQTRREPGESVHQQLSHFKTIINPAEPEIQPQSVTIQPQPDTRSDTQVSRQSEPHPPPQNLSILNRSLSHDASSTDGTRAPDAESEPLPQLPTVLANVSILQPLTASSPLIPPPSLLSAADPIDPPARTAAPSTPETISTVQAKFDYPKGGTASHPASADPSPNGHRLPVVSVAPVSADYSLPALALPRSSSSHAGGDRSVSPAANYAIPDAWSSVEDLLSQTRPTPTVQRFVDEADQEEELTSLRSQASRLNSSELSSDSLSALLNDLPSNNLRNATEPDTAIESRTLDSDIPASAPAQSSEQPSEQRSSTVEAGSSPSSGEESDGLESLAHAIYGLLRQRLELERERQGHYYSGRLPW